MISIKNLSFFYQKSEPLFESLDIELKPGNIYGLLGKNGAGKTTLMKLISGLLFPKSGSIDVFGHLPKKRTPDFLSDIFFLPEEFFLPDLTINKFISLYHKNYPKFNMDEFHKYLDNFELSLNSPLNNLSFGEKKRVIFSFGLATNCKLLLLDEPTNGLDIPSKTLFRKTLASAITDDKIIIVSTHVVRDVENLIDPIIIIDEGKIIVNSELFDISQKVAMEHHLTKPDGKLLYSEKVLGGYAVLTENNGKSESQIDIEILFNAIQSNKEVVNLLNRGSEL